MKHVTRTLLQLLAWLGITEDVMIRAGKTGVQGFAAAASLIAIAPLKDLANSLAAGGQVKIDVDFWRGILVSLLFAFLAGVWSVIHNAVLVKFRQPPINP